MSTYKVDPLEFGQKSLKFHMHTNRMYDKINTDFFHSYSPPLTTNMTRSHYNECKGMLMTTKTVREP